MCDTFVALPAATADGSVILAKNSDREPNEAHELVIVPAADHPEGGSVACTYITIPQVPHTHRVLLAKPYWIWGAEMGVNEHGVAIGNEAIFTKQGNERTTGLLGMDLLRLALERAASADEAVTVIGTLLGQYGQGGQAGHTHDLRYDNSYLIADPTGAWILETMAREWVARRVHLSDSISNGLTTRRHWDIGSAALAPDPTRGETGGLDIAAEFSDRLFTRFSDSAARQCRTADTLTASRGTFDVAAAFALLRDHGSADPHWRPDLALAGADVCMHAGFGPIRVSQTTGSMVAHLSDEGTTVWVSGTSAPCTSVFKPVWLDSGLPDLGPRPGRSFDPRSLWWRHELLHRAVLADYPRGIAVLAPGRAALEAGFLGDADPTATVARRRRITEAAFSRAAAAEAGWLPQVRAAVHPPGLVDRVRRLPYDRAWSGFNRDAGLP